MTTEAKMIIPRRSLAILALVLLSVAPVWGQGTVAPVPRQQFLDTNGNPLASGKLYTYSAGTTTPLSTYTTAALTVANTNPIILDSAGRATIFLTTASYKFILKTSADVEVWSVDNVSSVAPFNVDLDVTGTAGEAISAGELVYLSSGSGSLTAGRWYKADSDLTYASVAATQWGMAPAAIASGASGSIRLSGRVTGLSALSVGSNYYASATAGAITATPPTSSLRIGRADSSTSLILGNFHAPSGPRGPPPCGRLTLSSLTPVTVSDVTAATTLYYTPYGGCNVLSLFSGVSWDQYAFGEIQLAVPATTNQMYDVYVYDNAGVLTLELTAWTNDTTRAANLLLQNGVFVKTGATTRLYLGSVRTTGVSGQTEDSATKRFVYNYYRRVERPLLKTDTTATWAYNGVMRQARAQTTNQVEIVNGVAESPLDLLVFGNLDQSVSAANVQVAIGEDSTTAGAAAAAGGGSYAGVGQGITVQSRLYKVPAIGYHYYAWLEGSSAATTAWRGATVVTGGAASGLIGTVTQ